MRKLAIVNMKGGVGKTTTAIHIAAGFANRGARVLLVDVDPQGTIANTLRIRPDRTLADLVHGADLASVVLPDVRPNLSVVAATPTAFALETQLAGAVQRETLLARALRPLDAYDVLVLDTSPAMNLLTFNALLCAEELIIPIGMEPMAIVGARQTLDGIEQIRQLWPDRTLELKMVVPTSVNTNTHATRSTLETLGHDPRMAEYLFAPGIRQCLDLTYATAAGQTIWEYAPRSRAAEDYNSLLDALTGVPAQADSSVSVPHHDHVDAEKTQAVL